MGMMCGRESCSIMTMGLKARNSWVLILPLVLSLLWLIDSKIKYTLKSNGIISHSL